MPLLRFILCVTLICSFYVTLTAIALAQTTIPVDSLFGTWRPYIMEGVSVVVGLAITAAAGLFYRWTGYSIEQRHREALQTALTNAAGLAVAQAGTALVGKKIEITNPFIANAARYVTEGAPDALRFFNITPDRLRDMVMAKVPQVAPELPERKFD